MRYYSRFDDTRQRTDVVDNNVDAWYGHSIKMLSRDSILYGHFRLILSGRVSSTWFTERPYVSADTNLYIQRNTLLLGNIGFSRSAFFKDILVAGFGKVEDIPIGILLDATAGYQIGEFVSRPYSDIHISNGTYNRIGYFYNSFEIGSFFRDGNAEDGALHFQSIYSSKLIARKKLFKQRVLFRILYSRGIHRLRESDQLDLRDLNAVRGLDSYMVYGNTALAGGITLSIFSPWHLFGFRVAFFSLADIAYFGDSDRVIFGNRPYWSFSNGIRLNNENFIFGTIDFSFSIYPSPPPGVSAFSVGLHINPIFSFLDFSSKKPDIIRYGHPGKLYY